ncbi:Rad52/Rad22 family DNA repair protein [Candidatus Sulfurimonas baltica]|uniref:DNA repair protein Rad52 n=1 Tax=Candidatus Sulfurimonas baltica TaxID=2740404 RepID=A0A7S7LTP5_9BACT|nr:Rad52/Rad22 family DNA repair protein [Candidatus Sulfurimonas baltica]QOY51354.1 DNA repair protein Rad52 [Candidatus Sulfurimonas baltica]
MFSENQLKALGYTLDESRIKTIDKAGISFKYIETYDVINVANTIFSYMWDYTITRLEEVARETNQNGNHVITFSAIVKVKIYDNQRNFIEREDTGVGTGTARTIGEAIDNASKSAVSDSLKRSLRSLGGQFGNDLYSKSPNINQNYQQQPAQQLQQPQQYSQANQQQAPSSHNPNDYSSLYNIGLTIMEQGQNLVVIGDDIFSKRDSIKACGFRWEGSSKMWYKPIQQQQAA